MVVELPPAFDQHARFADLMFGTSGVILFPPRDGGGTCSAQMRAKQHGDQWSLDECAWPLLVGGAEESGAAVARIDFYTPSAHCF